MCVLKFMECTFGARLAFLSRRASVRKLALVTDLLSDACGVIWTERASLFSRSIAYISFFFL